VDLPAKFQGVVGRPIRLGDSVVNRAHICAFFSRSDDEYHALLPFIREGFQNGEKAVHTINPARRDDHVQRLTAAGIDVAATLQNGQFELRDWTNTHLSEGRFDQTRTLSLFEGIMRIAKQQGYPLIRFITHMEWALESCPGVDELLEYEAKANYAWLRQDGPVNPVVCTYDLSKFRGDIIVDVMRTHPLIIIGGILQENPFFIPPDEFLQELRGRHCTQ
jgi:hypothetical protein